MTTPGPVVDPLATPVSRASTWNIANALTVLRLATTVTGPLLRVTTTE